MEISQVELPPPINTARPQPAIIESPTSVYKDEKSKKKIDEEWEDEDEEAEDDSLPPPP